jgi:hypothetical protein
VFSGVRLRSTRNDAAARTPSFLTLSLSAASFLNSLGGRREYQSGEKEYQKMPDISLYSPELVHLSPHVLVVGEQDLDLAQDIISLQFCASLTRCKVLEVLVNNWGTIDNQIGYKYSGKSQGSDPIRIGTKIKLSFGSFTLATGNITTLAPNFPDGSPPTLNFSVDAHRPRQRIHSEMFTIMYGSGLREFHPVFRSGHTRIQASGVADGSPQLIAGVKLILFGVGNVFQGTYSVTESTHTYDMSHGYQTRFACVKELS